MMISGAKANRTLSTWPGVYSSLKMNFKPSASGCPSPNIFILVSGMPTRFGPRRSCTQAAIQRSRAPDTPRPSSARRSAVRSSPELQPKSQSRNSSWVRGRGSGSIFSLRRVAGEVCTPLRNRSRQQIHFQIHANVRHFRSAGRRKVTDLRGHFLKHAARADKVRLDQASANTNRLPSTRRPAGEPPTRTIAVGRQSSRTNQHVRRTWRRATDTWPVAISGESNNILHDQQRRACRTASAAAASIHGS